MAGDLEKCEMRAVGEMAEAAGSVDTDGKVESVGKAETVAGLVVSVEQIGTGDGAENTRMRLGGTAHMEEELEGVGPVGQVEMVSEAGMAEFVVLVEQLEWVGMVEMGGEVLKTAKAGDVESSTRRRPA